MAASLPCGEPCTPHGWLAAFKRHAAGLTPVVYRPASQPSPPTGSRIPSRIMMTSFDAAKALRRHGEYMRTWWQLNPEYEWLLLDEEAASAFVRRFCAREERRAYFRALVGAQRADLFRVYWLRALGGVYADTDLELRRPLRTFIPPNASLVVSERWEIEFMAYEPQHPLLRFVAAELSANVNARADEWLRRAERPCLGPHSCIILTTGPHAHRNAVIAFTRAQGCANQRWPPTKASVRPPSEQCANARLDQVRRIHVCRDGKAGLLNEKGDPHVFEKSHWLGYIYCGAMRHWDCRNSHGVGRSRCGKRHYSSNSRPARPSLGEQSFFNLSATGD
ncbi:hypothetical protein AB1Y20_007015 [Prymnesium parvum]|uniref:Alpha-1,4-N-acetylglucosaminyltransferase n=1 Tax=Prymnesium parvum TaxID=97485 RepID=A0AB34J2F4_PRYPA